MTRKTDFVPLVTTAIMGDPDGEHYIIIIKSDNLAGSSKWKEYDEMIRVELMEGMIQLVATGILLLDSKQGVIRSKSGKEFFRFKNWKTRFTKLSEEEKEMYKIFDYREIHKWRAMKGLEESKGEHGPN